MLVMGGSESSIEVRELAEYPSHGGSQGFKSPHLHPQKSWSPAWRVPSVRPAPSQIPLPGSKRAATATETAPSA